MLIAKAAAYMAAAFACRRLCRAKMFHVEHFHCKSIGKLTGFGGHFGVCPLVISPGNCYNKTCSVTSSKAIAEYCLYEGVPRGCILLAGFGAGPHFESAAGSTLPFSCVNTNRPGCVYSVSRVAHWPRMWGSYGTYHCGRQPEGRRGKDNDGH